jgi:serine/threonine protein kinase, bacterial
MPLNEGDVFAGYTILQLLGSGGMGEVYLAQHPRLPRRDALKVLSAALTADGEYRQRFGREADIAAELWHPHIVGIHDRGESEGRLWLSMDYVNGTDAAELLRAQYPSGMPKGDVFAIISAVADALDYAHLRGLLHRDVKPANILLTGADSRSRRILLADFGIAREIGDISGLTATNMVMGTTAYSAPEQLMGKDIDGRADQYALGCTAFHLLTGGAPYQNSNAAVVISQHLSAPPPQIGERRPDLAELKDVFDRVLSKEPVDRYASCSDFATALTGRPGVGVANTVAGQAVTAGPTTRLTRPSQPSPPKPRRRGLRPAVVVSTIATVVVLAVAAVIGAALLRHHENAPNNPTTAPTASSLHLSRYITDPSGVLTDAGRTEVEHAISRLYTKRNVHLWVAYVNDFAGLSPTRWTQEAMRANEFTDIDGLLAIATANRSFSFRPPAAMTDGTVATRIDAELIRKDRIAPAVRKGQWPQAALGAAEGLETAR